MIFNFPQFDGLGTPLDRFLEISDFGKSGSESAEDVGFFLFGQFDRTLT